MQCCVDGKTFDLIIIGSGPIGIESALMAQEFGYKVLVVEKGDSVAHNMRKLSYLDMFSPWYYNYSPKGIQTLKAHDRFKKPLKDYETTEEYLNNYLEPLAKIADIKISFNTQVIKIGKSKIAKTDLLGQNRKKYPFRILATQNDEEVFFYGKNIIDASGVYDNPLHFGDGRVLAINEKKYQKYINYHAIDKDSFKEVLKGKTNLVIGTTCCTAKSILEIKKHLNEDLSTNIIYINETGLKPYIYQLKNDIFHKRVDGVNIANELLDSFHPQVKVYEKSSIYKIDKNDDMFTVYLNTANGTKMVEVHNIISNCGFKADNSLYEELQIHECYASHSPMNLAGAMLEDTVDFRLTKTALDATTLQNPEPNFYILGAKSYGRNQGFSIHIGIGQVIELFAMLTNKDKYELAYSDEKLQQTVNFIAPKKKEVLSTTTTKTEPKVVADKEERYKTIADNLQEVIFETDLKQKITYLSPSWKKMTGFEVEEFMGLDWQILLAEESRNKGVCACNAFMSNDLDEYHEEFKILCKDGTYKWVEVRASILIDENGVAFGTIGSLVDITQRIEVLHELELKNRKLDELAITDELAGTYNRRHFNDTLLKEIDRAVRSNSYFALVMGDIDYFKPYNDTYGHQKGDEIIKEVAKVLKKTFNRQIDLVARYGGEEFIIILPTTPKEGIKELVEKARSSIENLQIEHINSKVSKYVTMSFGAICGKLHNNIGSNILINRVDEALYESKKNGRNQITVVDINDF